MNYSGVATVNLGVPVSFPNEGVSELVEQIFALFWGQARDSVSASG
jgi:hypothetical protein